MMHIAIIDDEALMLEQVNKVVKNCFGEDAVIETFMDGNSYLQHPDVSSFTLLFLDIDMPDINGFDLAQKLQYTNEEIIIIFMSHHEHLVYQTFQFSPFWFVRKSNLEKDITEALRHYHHELQKQRVTFTFKSGTVHRCVPLNSILYFESVMHDIWIHLLNKDVLKLDREKELTLQKLENTLNDQGFIRVHKSFLVNFRHIYIVNRQNVELKNQEKIRINPHKTAEIKKVFQQHLMQGGSYEN